MPALQTHPWRPLAAGALAAPPSMEAQQISQTCSQTPWLQAVHAQARAAHSTCDALCMQAFVARGVGSFGQLAYGACGYYQQSSGQHITDASLPYAWDAVAALATPDADYPGALTEPNSCAGSQSALCHHKCRLSVLLLQDPLGAAMRCRARYCHLSALCSQRARA
jgi:hypothetical protein